MPKCTNINETILVKIELYKKTSTRISYTYKIQPKFYINDTVELKRI